MRGIWIFHPGAATVQMPDDEHANAAGFGQLVERTRGAAEAGDAGAQNALADLYYEGGPGMPPDFPESVKWYALSAAQGNAEAMYSMGWACFSGEGASKSMPLAVEWLGKAAEKRHAKACRKLAAILYEGVGGVASDKPRARALWEEAASLGDVESAGILGKLFHSGDADTPQDLERALRHLKTAAELGDGQSMYLLGVIFREGKGVEKDAREAALWFDKAQEAGVIDSNVLFERGMEHYTGDRAEYSLFEAVKCFTAAADAGHAIAMTLLCRLYFEGLSRSTADPARVDAVAGFEQPRYEESHRWGVKAYRRGETDVGYYLGMLYEMGNGPAGVDTQIAMQWYLACIQNTASGNDVYRFKSMVALGRCYYKGGTWDTRDDLRRPQDFKRAAYWWHRAAQEGEDPAAMNHLGDMHRLGKGVCSDREKAKRWYEKAAGGGHPEAAEALRTMYSGHLSLRERLQLWVPMIVLAILLFVLLLFFLHQFNELAKDSWLIRRHDEDPDFASTASDHSPTKPTPSPTVVEEPQTTETPGNTASQGAAEL